MKTWSLLALPVLFLLFSLRAVIASELDLPGLPQAKPAGADEFSYAERQLQVATLLSEDGRYALAAFQFRKARLKFEVVRKANVEWEPEIVDDRIRSIAETEERMRRRSFHPQAAGPPEDASQKESRLIAMFKEGRSLTVEGEKLSGRGEYAKASSKFSDALAKFAEIEMNEPAWANGTPGYYLINTAAAVERAQEAEYRWRKGPGLADWSRIDATTVDPYSGLRRKVAIAPGGPADAPATSGVPAPSASDSESSARQSFALWLGPHWLSNEARREGDKFPALEKFAGDGAPETDASLLPPRLALRTLTIGGVANTYCTMTFRLANTVPDANLRVEFSTDPGNWNEPGVRVSQVDNKDGTRTECWRSLVPDSSRLQVRGRVRFLRVISGDISALKPPAK